MMMRKVFHRQAESVQRVAAHIDSIGQREGSSEAKLVDEVDFDTDLYLRTIDSDIEEASRRLSPEKFCNFVQLKQNQALSDALKDLKSCLDQRPRDPALLLPPLRQLVDIHRLPVAGLSENQRSEIRSGLSDCLATSSKPVLSSWMSAVLSNTRRCMEEGPANSHGDFSSPADYELLSLTLTICQNYSDSDATGQLAVTLATDGNSFIQLSREILSACLIEHLVGRLPRAIEQLVLQCIAVYYNLYMKQEPKVTAVLTDRKIVLISRHYLGSHDEDVRFAVYLLLVFACTEAQAATYLAETRLVELLINRLRLSLQTRDRRCQGYHCIELAKCALRMARNDTNKEQLVDSGLLILLTDMMSSGRADEQLVAMETALCLSFSAACIPRLREQCRAGFNTIRRVIELNELSAEDIAKLRAAMEALDFNLLGQTAESLLATRLFSSRCLATKQIDEIDNQEQGNKDQEELLEKEAREILEIDKSVKSSDELQASANQSEKKTADINEGSHVMISYHQATSSELATWLRDRLKEAGISVWLDRDSMQGSTLESMALAVESASIVLVCLSRGYKESNSCRMEAEYASRRGKRILTVQAEARYTPDGWLGILAGAQLLLDFTKPEAWAGTLPRLINSIRQTSDPSLPPTPPPPIAPPEPPPQVNVQSSTTEKSLPPQPIELQLSPNAQSLPPPHPPHRRAYADWSVERVANWLRDRSLSPHLEPHRLAGEHLEFLIQLRREAPEAFYRLLETQLRLNSFQELYNFVRALEALESGEE